MLFKWCATHVYGLFVTQKSMVKFIFEFDPRKGQIQVKLGQIRSNFKIQNYLTKVCLLCSFVSGFPKNVIFYVRQIEMPNIAFQKCDVIIFFCSFFGHCTAKKKRYCFKILFACCLYVLRSFYSVFGYHEKLGFYRQLFLKNKTLNLEVKIETNQKSEIARL